MQPATANQEQTRTDQMCKHIMDFVNRAKEDGKVLEFQRGLNGLLIQRITNLKCYASSDRLGHPIAKLEWERLRWFFGYHREGYESTFFYPICTKIEDLSASQMLIDQDWYFTTAQPWKLFNRDIW